MLFMCSENFNILPKFQFYKMYKGWTNVGLKNMLVTSTLFKNGKFNWKSLFFLAKVNEPISRKVGISTEKSLGASLNILVYADLLKRPLSLSLSLSAIHLSLCPLPLYDCIFRTPFSRPLASIINVPLRTQQ